MSAAVTEGILVEVSSAFVESRSSPAEGEYYFAYTVRIANGGSSTVKLVSRRWVIIDGQGHVEEVRGAGVVGHQPVLRPGEAFQYTSACPLGTSHGSMRGTFQMVRDDGTRFEATIAPFELAIPSEQHERLLN